MRGRPPQLRPSFCGPMERRGRVGRRAKGGMVVSCGLRAARRRPPVVRRWEVACSGRGRCIEMKRAGTAAMGHHRGGRRTWACSWRRPARR